MSFEEIDYMVRNFNPSASESDVASWALISYGETVDNYAEYMGTYFGGSGHDMFASYDDYGIYYQCYYSYDMGYDYLCDYYRIGTLYDGWTMN